MENTTLIPSESIELGKGNKSSTNSKKKLVNRRKGKKGQPHDQSAKAAVSLKPPKTKPAKKKNNKTAKNAKNNSNTSQSTKSVFSTAGSLPSVRPRTPYRENVMLRYVWLRPKQDDKFWVRGRIEKFEQSRVDQVGENGKVSTVESLFHVVKCADDGTLYRVQLEQMEQSENFLTNCNFFQWDPDGSCAGGYQDWNQVTELRVIPARDLSIVLDGTSGIAKTKNGYTIVNVKNDSVAHLNLTKNGDDNTTCSLRQCWSN